MGESEATTGFLPAQGSTGWYDTLLKLLEIRQITKVDKAFLEDQDPKIASHNETKFIAGLKFLGLIDKEGNATEAMDNLSLKGVTRKENLEKVVRKAYCLLFDKVKIKLEETDPNTLINCFKIDYKMGSLTTAEKASRVFVFLAQQAGIPLSEAIVKELGASQESKKTRKEGTKLLKPSKEKKTIRHGDEEEGKYALIPEGMQKMEYGDTFLMFLKKGDKKTRERVAKLVKQFTDAYVQEEETE